MRNIGVSVGDIDSDEQVAQDMEEPEATEEMPGPEVAGPVQSAPGASAATGTPPEA